MNRNDRVYINPAIGRLGDEVGGFNLVTHSEANNRLESACKNYTGDFFQTVYFVLSSVAYALFGKDERTNEQKGLFRRVNQIND